MNENMGLGFMRSEESKPSDPWLLILLAMIFLWPRSSPSSIKMDGSVENVRISEVNVSTEK